MDVAPELVKTELVPEPETEQPKLQAVPDAETTEEAPQLIDGRWQNQSEKDAYLLGQKELREQAQKAQQEYIRQQQARQQQAQQPKPDDYWRDLRKAYIDNLKAEAALAQEEGDPFRPVGFSYEQTVKTAMALAEKMVDAKLSKALGGVVEKLNEQDAEMFFNENPHLAPVRNQIRTLVEEQGASAKLIKEIVDGVRGPQPQKPQAREWDDFIESPSGNPQQVPQSLRKLEDQILQAQKEGNIAKRNALMERRWKK